MATLLYRLGRFSYRRRGRVVALWLLLLALLGGAAAAFSGPTTDKFEMPGTESQQAIEALQKDFPQASGGTGTLVLAAPKDGRLTPAQVAPVVKDAKGVDGVTAVLDPFATKSVSPDGRYALVQVQFDRSAQEVTDAQRAQFEEAGEGASGIRVEHGGEVMTNQVEVGSTEGIGVLVAAVVLVLTFGSLVAAGMTMLNALIGVGAGMAGLYALSSVIELTSTAPILALMLGLAVGIDYSLFLTSRYRHLVAEGLTGEEAAGRAAGTAGSAVVFAGATVVIALAGLSVVGIPFLSVMGLAAAGTVLVAVLVALTLLPAILGFAGVRVLPRKLRASVVNGGASGGAQGGVEPAADGAGSAAQETAGERNTPARESLGRRWGRTVLRLRIPLLLLAVVGLGAVALPTQDMRLALPDAGSAASDSPARKAYDLTEEGFGEGFNGRLMAVVSGDSRAETAAATKQVIGEIRSTEGVLAVSAPQQNASGTTALVPVIPKEGPTAGATEDAVHTIRAKVADVGGAEVALTGATALGIDVSEQLADALPIYLILVVGLSVLLLMLVFRSLLVPLKAAAGFLLTVGATFGITVAVFQQGHLAQLVGVDTPGPLVSFLPIILIGILFGLAMDYEVFLVSRMREEFVHGSSPKEAMVDGLGHNGRVVTAAALIMTSVFGGFVLMEDPIVKSIGFALAVGVLIDAFVVRMTLVPALMSLLGRAAWWLPRWLSRLLPNLDIEGESLRTAEQQAAPAPRESSDRTEETVGSGASGGR